MSWRSPRIAVARVSDEPEDRRRLWGESGKGGHRGSPAAECGNKRPFVSELEARRVLVADANNRRRQPGMAGQLHVYRCSYCHLWHMGHRRHETPLIECAGCGRPWRPRIQLDNGTVVWQRDADPTRCARCQPKAATG